MVERNRIEPLKNYNRAWALTRPKCPCRHLFTPQVKSHAFNTNTRKLLISAEPITTQGQKIWACRAGYSYALAVSQGKPYH